MMEYRDIEDYFESLVGYRYTKKELEEKLSEKFGKKITLKETTDKDNTDLDYMMTCNIIGDDDEDTTYWIDADVYYLKMRDKETLYITEVNVEQY